jgi:tRNA(adenine34) deaminase
MVQMGSRNYPLSPSDLNLLMQAAIEQAQLGFNSEEVPVGAVVSIDGSIVGRAHNLVETNQDASAHAEILALRQAAATVGSWRLNEAVLCVTLEPCPMCASALRMFRVNTLVFGVEDERLGACGSLFDLSLDPRFGALPRVVRGVREHECRQLLQDFFRDKRARRKG